MPARDDGPAGPPANPYLAPEGPRAAPMLPEPLDPVDMAIEMEARRQGMPSPRLYLPRKVYEQLKLRFMLENGMIEMRPPQFESPPEANL